MHEDVNVGWIFTLQYVFSRAFPPLKTCGGFEMLLAHEKSRTKLRVVNYGSFSADELRCLSTGRIYLRPIQTDIVLGDEDDPDDQFEDCFICKVAIPLRQMRTHMDSCTVCLLSVYHIQLHEFFSLFLVFTSRRSYASTE